eukprot:2738176-Prymnesium_polylepis.1
MDMDMDMDVDMDVDMGTWMWSRAGHNMVHVRVTWGIPGVVTCGIRFWFSGRVGSRASASLSSRELDSCSISYSGVARAIPHHAITRGRCGSVRAIAVWARHGRRGRTARAALGVSRNPNVQRVSLVM